MAVNPDSMTMRALRAIYLGDAPVRPLVGSPADGVAEVLLNVASVLNEGDRVVQALPLVQLAVWMRPRDAASIFLLGTVLEQDNRYRDAVAAFEKLEPERSTAGRRESRPLRRWIELERYGAASAALEKMAAERPKGVSMPCGCWATCIATGLRSARPSRYTTGR